MRANAAGVGAPGSEFVYAGFWCRVAASLIDSALLSIFFIPAVLANRGKGWTTSPSFASRPLDFFCTWVFPAVATILFWVYRRATPGKMLFHAQVLDAATGRTPSAGRLMLRYLGYFLSTLGFFLGFVWVAFDPKKQGWHDKLAGTVVVRPLRRDFRKELP